MAFLLDTNVISEIVRPKPAQHVLEWIETQTPSDLFLASQTIGELVRGARKVKDRARRERFESWIMKDLTLQFEDRILPFDNDAARIWGKLMGDGDRAGRTPSAADAQIAAVVIHRGLTLVTRNVRDCEHVDLRLLNPWD